MIMTITCLRRYGDNFHSPSVQHMMLKIERHYSNVSLFNFWDDILFLFLKIYSVCIFTIYLNKVNI